MVQFIKAGNNYVPKYSAFWLLYATVLFPVNILEREVSTFGRS